MQVNVTIGSSLQSCRGYANPGVTATRPSEWPRLRVSFIVTIGSSVLRIVAALRPCGARGGWATSARAGRTWPSFNEAHARAGRRPARRRWFLSITIPHGGNLSFAGGAEAHGSTRRHVCRTERRDRRSNTSMLFTATSFRRGLVGRSVGSDPPRRVLLPATARWAPAGPSRCARRRSSCTDGCC